MKFNSQSHSVLQTPYTVIAMWRLILLLALLSNTRIINGQQFDVKGVIVYTTAGDKPYQETRQFTVSRNESQWKIRTIDTNRGKSEESPILYEEAGCDGTNTYYRFLDVFSG